MDSKPTNPKDVIGSNKVPLHLFPATAKAHGALALLSGALKYGRSNWREAGVRASIYYDALCRHLDAWFEGEDDDPESGLNHLAHVLACASILVDAMEAGKLVDDRLYPGGYRDCMDDLQPAVENLREYYKNHNPKHWSIQDDQREAVLGELEDWDDDDLD